MEKQPFGRQSFQHSPKALLCLRELDTKDRIEFSCFFFSDLQRG